MHGRTRQDRRKRAITRFVRGGLDREPVTPGVPTPQALLALSASGVVMLIKSLATVLLVATHFRFILADSERNFRKHQILWTIQAISGFGLLIALVWEF
jgi:hypothetical protein